MPRIYDQALREQLKPGRPVTLVLGAGVSRTRGLPLWSELLREAWKAVFDEDPYAADAELLERARAACQRDGLPSDFLKRLDVRRHPFEIQFAFEVIYRELRWLMTDERARRVVGLRPRSQKNPVNAVTNEQRTSELFTSLLRKILYREHRRWTPVPGGPPDTLSLIAQAVRKSAVSESGQRLIDQVITFNVDDLLEREVNSAARRNSFPLAHPIHRPSEVRPFPTRHAIPIYHLHGFVPMRPAEYRFSDWDGYLFNMQSSAESLVFTDEQYWRTVGRPGSFASRIFTGALAGNCMFIGLSMTDLNIIRWLTTDAIERSDDYRDATSEWDDSFEAEQGLLEELLRHYWLTVGHPADGPAFDLTFTERVLINYLQIRGVDHLAIPSWDSRQFHNWWRARFLS